MNDVTEPEAWCLWYAEQVGSAWTRGFPYGYITLGTIGEGFLSFSNSPSHTIYSNSSTKSELQILHTLFALSVVKLRLRPSDKLTADEFLRLLFLQQTPVGQAFRASSRRVLNGSHGMPFRRTSSYPTAHDLVDESLYAPKGEFGQNGTDRHRLSIMRTQTDPSPSLFHSAESHKQDTGADLLPHALVISGLEHTSEQVQSALWTTLAQGQIATGHQGQQSKSTWPLPSHFLVIYVCPIGNGCERPPIHNSLVSRQKSSVGVGIYRQCLCRTTGLR